MEQKKEVQQTINPVKKENGIGKEEFYSILKLISPGSSLRNGIDGILNYGKGALIVIENEFLDPLLDGGFRVNCKFSHQKLVELSKMDGAIILSKDLKTIKYANVLLTPNSKIPTSETGTRHKAAERTAKQISGLTIAISEGRKEITLYYKNKRHKIKDVSEIVRKVNDYLQVLERQREILDTHLETLNKLELKNYVNLNHALKTVQKGKVIQKISDDLSKFLIEIGTEGSLSKTRLKEILQEVEKETNLIIKDYSNVDYKKSIAVLDNLTYEELLDKENVLKALDHESVRKIVNVSGWRILSKTTLSEPEIAKLVKEKDFFGKIISSNIDQKIDSISEDKFSSLKVELERLKLGI